MPGISAVVLAAGASTRMGAPKPLLAIEGRALLARVLETVGGSGAAEVVVVLGHEADRVRRAVPMEGAKIVLNPEYAKGMSTSLREGLHACGPDSEACVVLLVDQPLLKAETLRTIMQEYARAPAGILVPTFRGRRGNPVLLRRTVWPEVERLKGDRGFRAVFGQHAKDLREVPVDDPGILIDIDTPADLERIQRALDEKRPIDSLV